MRRWNVGVERDDWEGRRGGKLFDVLELDEVLVKRIKLE